MEQHPKLGATQFVLSVAISMSEQIQKRQRGLGSSSHLVEIDLLREHTPMPMIGVEETSDCRIVVSRAKTRPTADLYEFQLREPIPSFSLPLKPGQTHLNFRLPEYGILEKNS